MLSQLIEVRKKGKSSTVSLEDYLIQDRQKLYFVIDGKHLKAYQAVFTNMVKSRHNLSMLSSAIIKVGSPTTIMLRFNKGNVKRTQANLAKKVYNDYVIQLKAESELMAQKWVTKLQEYICEEDEFPVRVAESSMGESYGE